MSSTIEIDFLNQDIRGRVPADSDLKGDLSFATGLLLEGKVGGNLTVNGDLVLLNTARFEGMLDVNGDAYILGSVSVERAVIQGKLFIGSGANVSGYIQAKDFQLHAGSDVSASLNRLL